MTSSADAALDVVILGLSITSSWGNGHATNYRGLVRALTGRGHRVLFLERDVPWYADHRDLDDPPWGELRLYGSTEELRERFRSRVRDADAVVVGSYVPDGVEVGRWVNDTARGVTAFYDIDTPVTLAKLEDGDREYLEPGLVPRYDLYLSFTGGPALETLEDRYGSPAARSFHCMVDPSRYRPQDDAERRWDLGYLGTYSEDRQPTLERLLLEPARRRPDLRFCVAGPGYPDRIDWPDNVERIEHVPPDRHRRFYASQRFTLNVTRERMVRLGWSPSVRLFEAAACATPVITDAWPGLDHFFTPGEEILVASSGDDVLDTLQNGAERGRRIARRARRRVLAEHTAEHRAIEFERHVREARERTVSCRRADGERPDRARIHEEVERLAPWFHNLHLPGGVQTAPDHFLGDFPRYKWLEMEPFVPEDLRGWTALDVGCNAGFYSFELARRGARVTGVDHDERYLEQARWARGRFDLDDRVEFRRREVYDLGRSEETYDIVLFLGVLYHLRYPLLGLDAVARRVGRILLFQSMVAPEEEIREETTGHGLDDRGVLLARGWPRLAFLEHEFEGDPTNWWVPNPACVEAMLRSAGLEIRGRPARETWICRPRGEPAPRNGNELRAALAPGR